MSNLPATDWKKALQQQAAALKTGEGDAKHISLKGGVMSLNGEVIPNNELQCIVLGYAIEKAWYDRPYSSDDVAPPECFAIGENQYHLKAHENAAQKQAAKCEGCPLAEFGTAKQGAGPACKTRLRLVVMPAPDNLTPAMIKDGETAMIKTFPTSVLNFTGVKNPGYLRQLAQQGLMPWAVVTKIKVAPHPKKLNEMTFELVKPLKDEKVLAASYAKSIEEEGFLNEPFPKVEGDVPPAQDAGNLRY